jgi:hypothetical protein
MEPVHLQGQLDSQKRESLGRRRCPAILVANIRIAYLTRIAFRHTGEAHYRAFYNDFAPALDCWRTAGGKGRRPPRGFVQATSAGRARGLSFSLAVSKNCRLTTPGGLP